MRSGSGPARRPAIGFVNLIACREPILAPQARRFAQDTARRCGTALDVGPGERAPAITIYLGEDPALQGLPAPLGLHPAGTARDERYALTVDRSGIRLRAPEPPGVARGLTSLLQLIATSAEATTATSATLPALDILDGPRFAWRGLTVDVVRRFFPPAQIRTLIDLAALYKLDVLHLHLTDDQGWRIEAGRPAPLREPDGSFYTNDELRALISYAADRFVTLLPEVGDYVRHLKHAVRALGKRSVGWQESIRAGADPGHVIQYWMDASSLGAGAELPPSPEVTARVRANYLRGRADIEQALAHGVPVIVSPQAYCYFDVPYAEAAADPGQRERRDQVGLRHYARRTLEATFDWDPATTVGVDHVAGVGAALWCETVRDADDLTFLLLPRLAGTAEKAWGPAGAVTWPEHRDALAQHTRLWEQDGLTFFSAA